MRLAPLLASARDDWNTPRVICNLVERLGPIGLDPCSNAGSIVPARVKWTIDDDGLSPSRPWSATLFRSSDEIIYVNPPYGRAIRHWVARADQEYSAGASVVGLLPARVDTYWWQRYVAASAAAVCFWRGRLTFLGARDPAPFPSALVLWTDESSLRQRFREALAPHGWCVELRPEARR